MDVPVPTLIPDARLIAEWWLLLETGRETLTITSRHTGQHVTLKLRCEREGVPVRFVHATHIEIEDFDGEPVATMLLRQSTLRLHTDPTSMAGWTARALMFYLADSYDLPHQAEIDVAAEPLAA